MPQENVIVLVMVIESITCLLQSISSFLQTWYINYHVGRLKRSATGDFKISEMFTKTYRCAPKNMTFSQLLKKALYE